MNEQPKLVEGQREGSSQAHGVGMQVFQFPRRQSGNVFQGENAFTLSQQFYF